MNPIQHRQGRSQAARLPGRLRVAGRRFVSRSSLFPAGLSVSGLSASGLVALLFAAAPASGQLPPSVLELLPTEGRTLVAGTPATGVLGTLSDHRLPDGQPVQAWELRGEPGSWLWVDLVSDAFDAYLFVYDPERRELLVDDDSGGGCHARIPVVIPPGGRMLAVASQVGLRMEGPFTLSASTEELPAVPGPCAYAGDFGDLPQEWFDFPAELAMEGRFESVPGTVTGTLAPGQNPAGPMGATMVSWDAELVAGQTLQIDLTSEDFDTILLMTGPGIDGYFEDDDGGEGLNSRITFTVLVGGTYQLHVTGFDEDSAGSYRLEIAEVLPPG